MLSRFDMPCAMAPPSPVYMPPLERFFFRSDRWTRKPEAQSYVRTPEYEDRSPAKSDHVEDGGGQPTSARITVSRLSVAGFFWDGRGWGGFLRSTEYGVQLPQKARSLSFSNLYITRQGRRADFEFTVGAPNMHPCRFLFIAIQYSVTNYSVLRIMCSVRKPAEFGIALQKNLTGM